LEVTAQTPEQEDFAQRLGKASPQEAAKMIFGAVSGVSREGVASSEGLSNGPHREKLQELRDRLRRRTEEIKGRRR